MALDGIFLHHITAELKENLTDSRVSQIYQPNRDELTVVFRTFNGTKIQYSEKRASTYTEIVQWWMGSYGTYKKRG